MTQFYFVSGIDTDIGKTVATGYLARMWLESGLNVTTVKAIQTGATTIQASDIATHRALMQKEFDSWDIERHTTPYLFPYPASPHLASQLCGAPEFDGQVVQNCIQKLAPHFDRILIEGAGGLMVPLRKDLLTIDWVARMGWPVILVTSGRLGSINHTLLSLEALNARHIPVSHLLYNAYGATSPRIQRSTRSYLEQYLAHKHPTTQWVDMPLIEKENE